MSGRGWNPMWMGWGGLGMGAYMKGNHPPSPKNRQTRLKTLPSRHFVGRWLLKETQKICCFVSDVTSVSRTFSHSLSKKKTEKLLIKKWIGEESIGNLSTEFSKVFLPLNALRPKILASWQHWHQRNKWRYAKEEIYNLQGICTFLL